MQRITFICAALVAAALSSHPAAARPVLYADSTSAMVEYGAGDMKEAALFHAPEYYFSFGVGRLEVDAPGADLDRVQRSFYTSSSCGVCGKGALEAVAVEAPRIESPLTVALTKGVSSVATAEELEKLAQDGKEAIFAFAEEKLVLALATLPEGTIASYDYATLAPKRNGIRFTLRDKTALTLETDVEGTVAAWRMTPTFATEKYRFYREADGAVERLPHHAVSRGYVHAQHLIAGGEAGLPVGDPQSTRVPGGIHEYAAAAAFRSPGDHTIDLG